MISLEPDLEKRAVELHLKSLIVEAHSDVASDVVEARRKGGRKRFQSHIIPRLRKGGVDLVGLAVGGDGGYGSADTGLPIHTLYSLLMIADVYQELEESGDDLLLVRRKADLDRIKLKERPGFILYLTGTSPLSRQVSFIRLFYELGVRMIGFTWQWANEAGAGLSEPRPSGLTQFGRECIQEMNRLGIIVDVAHVAETTIKDILEFSKHPVFATHSNAKAVCNHVRNLSDETIKAIAAGGGVIGLVFFPTFVTSDPRPTIEHVMAHVDHIVDLVGPDHLAIGADFIDYRSSGGKFDKGSEASERLVKAGIVNRETGGSGTFEYPYGIRDVTEFPNLTKALVARGYSDSDVQKIMGGNVLRLIDTVWTQ